MATPYILRDATAADVRTLVAFTLQEASEAEGYAADEAAVRRGVEGAFGERPLATYWVAECQGALDLRLYAHSSNERALRAYRRHGFGDAPYVILTKHLGR